jgi:hypothetical protein
VRGDVPQRGDTGKYLMGLFGSFWVRTDVQYIDGGCLFIHSPPDSITAREVILVDAGQWTSQSFGLVGDWSQRSQAQVGIDELAGLFAPGWG